MNFYTIINKPLASCYPYARLMRWHRPVGTLLLLWPTLMALFLANHGTTPSWDLLLIFSLGVFIMRSAGCVINDYADKEFDGHVARTSVRPLVTGTVRPRAALLLLAGLLGAAFFLVLMTNRATILLSIPAALLALIYPFMKRYIQVPQLILGLAFAWGVPMAYTAQNQPLSWETGCLFMATVFWALAYDTQYALADKSDDLKIGVKSTAILFGTWAAFWIGCCQLLVLGFFLLIGLSTQAGVIYDSALLIAALLMLYQQWLTRAVVPQACLQAFLNNQWVGAVLTLGIVLDRI